MTNQSATEQNRQCSPAQRETLLQALMLLFELDKTGMSHSDRKLLYQAALAIHTVIENRR
jgi:hypothetical protein